MNILRLFTLSLCIVLGLSAQSVSGQTTTTGPPPQTATATANFKKIPKLTMTLSCPGVPQDAAGNYLVVAGTSVSCSFTVNLAPTADTTVTTSSTDTTQVTVPASVTIPSGTLSSAAFNVTATP